MARVNIYHTKTLTFTQKKTTPLVQRTARQILSGAKRLAPRGDHLSGSGERHPGVALQPSLNASVSVGVRFIQALVGSKANHAATMHQGSKAHRIAGRGKMLAFEWDRGQFLVFGRGGNRRGRVMFFFKSVRHPGNKRPVRYLTTPMHLFGRMNGFRTTSVAVGRTRLP